MSFHFKIACSLECVCFSLADSLQVICRGIEDTFSFTLLRFMRINIYMHNAVEGIEVVRVSVVIGIIGFILI